jgi:hypothetical protein
MANPRAGVGPVMPARRYMAIAEMLHSGEPDGSGQVNLPEAAW